MTMVMNVSVWSDSGEKLRVIERQTGCTTGEVFERLVERADTSPFGLFALFPDRFKGWSVENVDPVPTPYGVTVDMYGESFAFKADASEARRLIKAMERVLAARKDVTRLKRELATAEAASFLNVGIGEGISVDDPDAVKAEAA